MFLRDEFLQKSQPKIMKINLAKVNPIKVFSYFLQIIVFQPKSQFSFECFPLLILQKFRKNKIGFKAQT